MYNNYGGAATNYSAYGSFPSSTNNASTYSQQVQALNTAYGNYQYANTAARGYSQAPAGVSTTPGYSAYDYTNAYKAQSAENPYGVGTGRSMPTAPVGFQSAGTLSSVNASTTLGAYGVQNAAVAQAATPDLKFLDFSLDIMRRLPSKKVNFTQYSEASLQKYRNTSEETNVIIDGLKIAEGLAALGYVSDGKTHKEILKLLNYACFGSKSLKSLDDCFEHVQTFMNARNSNSNNKQAIRMFFEQRDVTLFDKEIVKKLDEKFLETLPAGNIPAENNNKHILHECNFVCDPSGMNATEKAIKKVIRSDLAPDWRARFLLAVASDESFQLKTDTSSETSIGYFYDSFEKANKSWCTFLKVKICVRSFEASDCFIHQILTTNENETLIIILPKNEKLSNQFLPKLSAEKVMNLINSCSGEFTEKVAIIPKLSIPGSIGLRSILDKKIPFFSNLFGTSDPFAISRIFCPFKAEFSKIIGKKLEACLVFPLYEFYCKFRCIMKYENDEQNEGSPVPPPPPPSPAPNVLQNEERAARVVGGGPLPRAENRPNVANRNELFGSGRVILIQSRNDPANVALYGGITLHLQNNNYQHGGGGGGGGGATARPLNRRHTINQPHNPEQPQQQQRPARLNNIGNNRSATASVLTARPPTIRDVPIPNPPAPPLIPAVPAVPAPAVV
uniref:Serpin domain-containing protein n=1 Tax=Panagrolaimus sp. ES5 TaxID=591445 RepID=A0AC34FJ90_9BILA